MPGPPEKTTVTATAYLVVQGLRYKWSTPKPINGAKIVSARQSRPTSLTGDQIVVKVKVELPKRAFEPLEPEALIVVPEELVQHVVAVEAVDD